MRMHNLYGVLRLLNAYDQKGQLLGKMRGGTIEDAAFAREEKWNETNAAVFIGENSEREMPLREIFFDKAEVAEMKRALDGQ